MVKYAYNFIKTKNIKFSGQIVLSTNLEIHFIPFCKCKISIIPLTNIKLFYLHLHGVFLFLTSLKICCWKLLVFLQSPETQQIFPKYLGWQKSQNKHRLLYTLLWRINFLHKFFYDFITVIFKKVFSIFFCEFHYVKKKRLALKCSFKIKYFKIQKCSYVSFCIPFGIRVMLASLNELWSIFSSIFWRTLNRTVCLFFLRCLNSSVNLSGPRFSLWQSLTTFYFFNKLRAIQIIYFLHELC